MVPTFPENELELIFVVQILIGGDSAGGNLTAALLAHLTHPHPDVPSLTFSGNLGGALLVSPWVSFTQERESWKTNSKRDALDPATVRIWSNNFMGKTGNDNWSQPAQAPAEWWTGLRVDDVAITSGGDEILRDDIRVFAKNIKVSVQPYHKDPRRVVLTAVCQAHNPKVEYFEAPGEAHDAIVMEKMFFRKEDYASEQFIHRWILARLS